MYIYNVTVKINHLVHNEWLEWMKTKHIHEVLNTKCFVDYKICRVLEQDETDGITYAIQYFCENLEKYRDYQKNFAPSLQQEHSEKYKDNFVAFRTLMQII